MKSFKTIILFIKLILIIPFFINANNDGILQQEQEGLVYKKAKSYGFLMHGNGFGLNVDLLNLQNYYKRKFYRFEIVTTKHPKEYKETSFLNRNRPYAFGKINSFFNVQATKGQMNLLADKGRKNGVEISWLYAYGVAIGITKPYYLLNCAGSEFCNEPLPIKYSTETAGIWLNPPQGGQVSKAPSSLGWSEVKIHPGIHAKLGINIDFALFDDLIQAVEFGVKVNAYAKRIPIIVGDNNRFIFPNVYIKASVGRRIY